MSAIRPTPPDAACSSERTATSPGDREGRLPRRRLLVGAGLAATAAVAAGLWPRGVQRRASVFIAKGQRYDGPLATTIRDGLLAVGVDPAQLRGKRVLLKPNMVEPTRQSPHVSTHPAVVLAAAEVFRRWEARVVVGEGPGHLRDTEVALFESGLGEALRTAELPFADLNYEELAQVPNRGRASKLVDFHFPRSVVEADVIVSLPKMKTHHWVGLTGAMKNLYGVIPGIHYGWPKNVLHHQGIPQTVFDINASLPSKLAIVDGIVGMEGDGPIMGTAKPMGLLVIGRTLPAVDATLARLMELNPHRIPYLNLAAGRLGTIDERWIEQRGEAWRPLASRFEILDQPHLRGLRV